MPFVLNGTTSELVVTAPVDREEKEFYRLVLMCLIKTEDTMHTLVTPMHINIFDEDDSPPYVNGTDTEDVLIEFSRSKVSITQKPLNLIYNIYHTIFLLDKSHFLSLSCIFSLLIPLSV